MVLRNTYKLARKRGAAREIARSVSSFRTLRGREASYRHRTFSQGIRSQAIIVGRSLSGGLPTTNTWRGWIPRTRTPCARLSTQISSEIYGGASACRAVRRISWRSDGPVTALRNCLWAIRSNTGSWGFGRERAMFQRSLRTFERLASQTPFPAGDRFSGWIFWVPLGVQLWFYRWNGSRGAITRARAGNSFSVPRNWSLELAAHRPSLRRWTACQRSTNVPMEVYLRPKNHQETLRSRVYGRPELRCPPSGLRSPWSRHCTSDPLGSIRRVFLSALRSRLWREQMELAEYSISGLRTREGTTSLRREEVA